MSAAGMISNSPGFKAAISRLMTLQKQVDPDAPGTSGTAEKTNDVGVSNHKPGESAKTMLEPPAKRPRPDTGPEGEDEETDSEIRPAEDATRPSKRQRLDLEQVQSDSITTTDSQISTPVLHLPLELLAEILIFTGSPQYVLAFARTCKRFCHTLLGEDAQFIWRAARNGPGCSFKEEKSISYWPSFSDPVVSDPVTVSLPDPPVGTLSEAAYAAFVFDDGVCEFCGSATKNPYSSFALRFRLCSKSSCRNISSKFHFFEDKESVAYQRIRAIIPQNETEISPNYGYGVYYWPYTRYQYSRPDDIHKAKEYSTEEGTEEYKKKFESLKKRNQEWMQFCVDLSKWQSLRKQRLDDVKAQNKNLAEQMAARYGWNHSFLTASFFGSYLEEKTKLLEIITQKDVSRMHDQIELDLLRVQEKNTRRVQEVSLMENRKDVGDLYNALRSKKAYNVLPALPTFRLLPVVSVLQAGQHQGKREKKIMNTLQSNAVMQNLLDQQIHEWVETAKQDLAVVLGFPRDWKTASKLILHPVERITAWFSCVRCKSVEKKYMMDGCLDFAGACAHVCRSKNGKNDKSRKGKRAAWNPAKFIKDDKAINVMKQCLEFLDRDDTKVGRVSRQSDRVAVCTSCNLPIVLGTTDLVGHSHRHDDMQVSFHYSIDKMAALLAGLPYDRGIVQRLLLEHGEPIKKEIATKNFGCRHCLAVQKLGKTAESAPDLNTSVKLPLPRFSLLEERTRQLYPRASQEKYALFDFNGLRSHLKAKHGYEDIRDEDVFRVMSKESDETAKVIDVKKL